MASDAGKNFDWSARHTRMRAELVLISLIVFAIAQPGVKLSETSILLFNPNSIPLEYLLVGLAFWWSITFSHFLVRTSVEWNAVFAAFGDMTNQGTNAQLAFNEALREIKQNSRRPFSPEGSMDQVVNAVVARINPMPATEHMVSVSEPNATIGPPERLATIEEMKRFNTAAQAHTVEEIKMLLERERKSAEESYDKFLTMVDDAQREVEEISHNIAENFAQLRKEIRGALHFHRWDRFVFGILVPITISIAFAALSASAVLTAFEELFKKWL